MPKKLANHRWVLYGHCEYSQDRVIKDVNVIPE